MSIPVIPSAECFVAYGAGIERHPEKEIKVKWVRYCLYWYYDEHCHSFKNPMIVVNWHFIGNYPYTIDN